MSNESELDYGEVSNIVTGISGIICAPIVFTLLAVVVFAFRAFKTTFQRLILYHILFTLLCEFSFALQILVDSSRSRWLCVAAIYLYLYLYSLFSWYIYTTTVTNYLFLLTLRLLRGNPNIWQHGKFAECFCVFFSLALPITYMWLPIRDGTYETLNCDNSSSTKWDKDAIFLNIAVLVLCLEILVISIILCSLFCYLRRVYKAQRQFTTLLKHFIYHTGISSMIVGFMILVSVNSLYRHYHRSSSSKSLSAIIYAIDGVIEPLLMLISAVFQTLLSIRHQNGQYCQKFCRICYKSRHKATSQERHYMDTDRNENQTNPPSNPLNQPSHTHFSIPYTGGFTQVTVNSDKHYRCTEEYTPLMRSGKTA